MFFPNIIIIKKHYYYARTENSAVLKNCWERLIPKNFKTFFAEFKGATKPRPSSQPPFKGHAPYFWHAFFWKNYSSYQNIILYLLLFGMIELITIFDDNNCAHLFQTCLWICLFLFVLFFGFFHFTKEDNEQPLKNLLWMQVRRTQDWNSIF